MKKQLTKYFILSLVSLGLGFVSGVVGIVLNTYALIFLIVAMVLILLGVGLLFADRVILKERKEQEVVDQENIVKSLNSYQNNGKLLVKVKSNEQGLIEIGKAVNDIIVNDTILEHKKIYDGNDFFMMVRKFIRR